MANTQDGLEWSAEFSLEPTVGVGSYVFSGVAAGAFTAGCAWTATQTTLLAVCTSDIGSATGVLYVIGSNGAAGVTTGTTFINPNACIGFTFPITASGAGWVDINAMGCSGGAAGDTFEIVKFPVASARTNLAFIRGLRSSEGVTFRNVPLRYDPTDHTKRTRGEKTISFEAPSETGQTGLQAVRDRREWTLILHKDTDGDGTVTETAIYEKVSGSLDKTNPIEGVGEVVDPFTGNYKRRISIMANI